MILMNGDMIMMDFGTLKLVLNRSSCKMRAQRASRSEKQSFWMVHFENSEGDTYYWCFFLPHVCWSFSAFLVAYRNNEENYSELLYCPLLYPLKPLGGGLIGTFGHPRTHNGVFAVLQRCSDKYPPRPSNKTVQGNTSLAEVKETMSNVHSTLVQLGYHIDPIWFISMYKTYIHYVYMGDHIHIDHSRARIRGEEGQDSDIQTMRSEEQVAEEFGSWHEYMELQRQVSRKILEVQFHWTKWRYVTIVYHIVKETIYIYIYIIYIHNIRFIPTYGGF